MAKKDPSLNDKLLQENITEDEIDELRANGQGFQREPGAAAREPVEDHRRESDARVDSGDEVERLMVGQTPSDDPRSYQTPELENDERAMKERSVVHDDEAPPKRAGTHDDPNRREMTGDESLTEQERSAGRFETEGQPTQLEQDFGEIGRNMRGSIHDSAHEPSILDPDEE